MKKELIQIVFCSLLVFCFFCSCGDDDKEILTEVVNTGNTDATDGDANDDENNDASDSDTDDDDSTDNNVNVYIVCPDDHHPHAIDLGLPSGTKWACCNVGASTPEEYGGYYAWGETEEKSVYTENTYAYYNSSTRKYVDIGSDISGTLYDVAHVKMGSLWRMPSTKQQQELKNYCSRLWTTQNEVFGILVTGENGGTVFFPAAGARWYDGLSYVESDGYCWSSSLNPSNDGYAYFLVFNSGGWNWGYGGRSVGHSVRAVCP